MQKMIVTLFCAVALVTGASHAATVEEILAAQPAQNTADQAKWSGALIALGKDTIVELSTRLKPAGGGDDLAVRYALSGIAKHATRPGAAGEAALVADAFADALAQTTDTEVRVFLLEQIQYTGGDAEVERVAALLNDADLASPAARALEAVGTAKAKAALRQALDTASGPQLIAVLAALDAIGEDVPEMSAPAEEMAPTEVIVPDAARESVLAKLQGMSGRELEAYIESTQNPEMRDAALALLATTESRRALSVCIDAIEGGDAALRSVALAVAEDLDEKSTSKRLLRALKKLDGPAAHDTWRTVVRRGDADVPPAPKGVDAEGFTPLFNGADLDGWDGNRIGYEVQNGTLAWREGGKNIYTDEDFADFHLRFEFKLSPGSNNGLGVRVPLGGHAAYDGMEIQILDDDDPKYADIKDYQHHGSIYGVVPAKPGHLRPDGEWNTQEVIAKGDQVTVILNGTTIVDADIREASKNGTLDDKDHPGLLNPSGRLAFLGHNTPVWYRNVYVKKL